MGDIKKAIKAFKSHVNFLNKEFGAKPYLAHDLLWHK